MPNIAAVLKSEISRIARKEARTATASTKKGSRSHRADIAALKKRVLALELQLRRIAKVGRKPTPEVEPEAAGTLSRFSPKGLKSMRRRLGLSAHDLGLLIGASSQSVYNWEDRKSRPQAKYLAALAFVKTKSKRDVAARLETLKA
jgi:DNA-binding transcriptional regulator YiaG